MKKPACKTIFLIISIAVTLTVGCGPQEPPSVKKCRAIAAENIELKRELAKSNKEIEILTEDYSKEIKAQKKMLQTCLREKEQLKEKSRQNVRNQVSSVLNTVLEENKTLREENTQLKAQIEELRIQN